MIIAYYSQNTHRQYTDNTHTILSKHIPLIITGFINVDIDSISVRATHVAVRDRQSADSPTWNE